jgi:hypothetical protein
MKKKKEAVVPQIVENKEVDFYSLLNRRPGLAKMPIKEDEAHDKCTQNNCVTLLSWHDQWRNNVKANLKEYRYFDRDHSVKCFLNDCIDSPVICVASGPSLVKNIQYLKLAQELRIPIITGAHSLMYLKKLGIKPNYVTLLDSGVEWLDYLDGEWGDIPLLVSMDMSPEYLKKWKGPKYFFRATFPDDELGETMFIQFSQDIGHMPSIIPTGGHTGGLTLSLANMVLNASEIIMVGYDYAYDNKNMFYPEDTEIDRKSSPRVGLIGATTITGETVATSPSYLGFKIWADVSIAAMRQRAVQMYLDPKGKPRELLGAEFINATEGGILGSYAEGNVDWIRNMKLEDACHYANRKNHLKFSKRMELDAEAKKKKG